MKPLFFLILFFSMLHIEAQQRLLCRDASVKFFSTMPLENITAINNQGLSVIDLKTGIIEFSVLLKGFIFPNALMQEHFNENYVESSKYPRAYFKGTIQPFNEIRMDKDAEYKLSVKGTMQLHGITKDVNTNALLQIKDGKITGDAVFDLLLEDYSIQIPKLVKDKIAKNISITIKAIYQNQKNNL